MPENRTFIPIDAIRSRPRAFSEVITHSHRMDKSRFVDSLENREHFARPYPGGNYDFLAINVPSTYQQGLIPDGEEPPWGMLRVVASANELHGLNAGILDAHRLRLQPDEIRRQIIKSGAKVVGLNPTSVNVPPALEIANICDDLGVPYILGGIHATLDPDSAREDFPTAAAIVKGNGEIAIKGAVEATLDPSSPSPFIPGVYFKEQEIGVRIDYAQKLPPGDVPLVRQDIYIEDPIYRHDITINGVQRTINEATLFVTEGCPFACTFCSSPVMVGRGIPGMKAYSRPHMERILDEMDHAVDVGADALHFLDDMAFVTRDHIDGLYDGMRERGLMGNLIWRGLTRAPVIERFDNSTMQKMKDTGVWKIALGVESGNEDILKQIQKRVTTEQVETAVKKLISFGVETKGFFIMGFPGETESQMIDTMQFALKLRELGMSEISVFQFKPYPGTGEYDRLKRTNPTAFHQLDYLKRTMEEVGGDRARNRAEDAVWLPDDVQIAAIPSGSVREIVTNTLEQFYGSTVKNFTNGCT